MASKLLVFDSHPVQYRVPIWQYLESNYPGSIHVVYASDCSVRGHADKDFGQTVTWDEPMLTGYDHTILNCEKGEPLSSWSSLTGKGVDKIIKEKNPAAVLLTGLNYKYDLKAYLSAKRKGIPVWLRCETQDQATSRSRGKALVRSMVYRAAYQSLSKVFYIGELNKQHYLSHGVSNSTLRPARYGTVDRFSGMSLQEKSQLRESARTSVGISPGQIVIGFSGKFIEKKNPKIFFEMLPHIAQTLRDKIHLYFMGSGPLEHDLKNLADKAFEAYGVKSYFSGFVNQSQLAGHYLAMDIMVLPSRQMGETWGLVANEAMQGGCGVVVTDVVGCNADFKTWPRFKVFPESDYEALAKKIEQLAEFPRSFDWASQGLEQYSIQATAESIISELKNLIP